MVTQKQKKKQIRKQPVLAKSNQVREKTFESDGVYFLKLVILVLLGTFWLKFKLPVSWMGIPFNGIPLGLVVGLILVNLFEKYQSDRKIWYAMLIIVAIISYFSPAGIVL